MLNLMQEQAMNYESRQSEHESLLSELQELEDWETENAFSDFHAKFLITRQKGQFKPVLQRIVQRLRQETDIDSKLGDIINLESIIDLQAFIDSSKEIHETEFEEEERKAELRGKNILIAKADYNRSQQALIDLANGILPDDFISLYHERIHQTQRGFMRLFKPYDPVQTLVEDIQAYKGEEGLCEPEFDAEWLEKQVLLCPFISQNLSVEDISQKVHAACAQIDRLIALGISQREIGRLVKKTSWNAQKVSFTGLESPNLPQVDEDMLLACNRLRNRINLLKIKRISQEELKVYM